MAIKRLREASIVGDDFYAHAARLEFASGSFEAGLPVEDIRKQTGHKSIKALEAYNKSDALHPDARARVDAVGKLGASERYDDLAAALGVTPDQLREFQRQNAVVPLRVVSETIAKATVARPLRKPVLRVVPKGTKKPATAK